MTQQTDQTCTIIIICIVVILICMGCSEMSRMRMRYGNAGSCGRKVEVNQNQPKNTSAKVGPINPSINTDKDKNRTEPSLSGNTIATSDHPEANEAWSMSTPETDCKHKEYNQVESELKKSYNEWQATPEETAKFPVIDKAKISKNANTRALHFNTRFEEPTRGRRLGMPGFRDMYDGHTKPQKVTFGATCPEFNGSDAHFAARSAENLSCKN